MRFISEDTNKGDVKDSLSLNLYVYCAGNPINFVDITGFNRVSVTFEMAEGHGNMLRVIGNDMLKNPDKYAKLWSQNKHNAFAAKSTQSITTGFALGTVISAAIPTANSSKVNVYSTIVASAATIYLSFEDIIEYDLVKGEVLLVGYGATKLAEGYDKFVIFIDSSGKVIKVKYDELSKQLKDTINQNYEEFKQEIMLQSEEFKQFIDLELQ